MSTPIQQVSILGSTGSIGVNTLRVIADHPDRYQVFALTANTSVGDLFKQCLEFQPKFAVMVDEHSARELQTRLTEHSPQTEVLVGVDGLVQVASCSEVDSVMAAIVGGAGLIPTLAAANAGKKILLANKESLVMAGELFMEAINQSDAQLIPIDSEHNAIFQCLPINSKGQFVERDEFGFEKIVLTASGGPFLNMPEHEFEQVTPELACKHPNWKMGPKISVDSATLLNKALELIEASYLFMTEAQRIEIVVHPQSIVHSMVHYRDGSVLAQLGNPDMRTPIAYGLAWPERISSGVDSLDLTSQPKLEFFKPDEERFPCLKLGREAALTKGTAPIILNAANELAVEAFLAGKLSFTQIPVIIDAALNQQKVINADSIETVLEEDSKARVLTVNLLAREIDLNVRT